MADFYGQQFVKQRVVIDGNNYDNCTFNECEIVFGAGPGDILMKYPSFNDCRFTLEGAAASTIKFLTALYQVAPVLVEQTFENVRMGRFPEPRPIEE